MPVTASVFSTIKVVGFHFWDGAPQDVDYLASRHRHIFTFCATVRTQHDNRDVEFHTLQRDMRSVLAAIHNKTASPLSPLGEFEFGGRSCEMLAREMGDALLSLAYAVSVIEVNEDDENGARVLYT